jgi:hypothetical protein
VLTSPVPQAVPLTLSSQRPASWEVVEYELPISGSQVVISRRGMRHVLEVFDASGALIAVTTNSELDPSIVRGAWRGTRNGQPWALVAGRAAEEPIAVVFRSRGLRLSRRRFDAAASKSGDFWVLEAATSATHATITSNGLPIATVALQRT